MEHEKYIADFVKSKNFRTDSRKKACERQIIEALKFFDDNGITAPIEKNFEEFSDYLSNKSNGRGGVYSQSTIRGFIATAKEYFYFTGEQNINMNDNYNTQEQAQAYHKNNLDQVTDVDFISVREDSSTAQQQSQDQQQEQSINRPDLKLFDDSSTTAGQEVKAEEKQPARRGRRPRPADKQRTEKFSVYLTSEQYRNILDLALSYRRSVPDFVSDVVSAFIERKRDRLDKFRELLTDEDISF